MFPWLFNVYMDAVVKKSENRHGEDRSEIYQREERVDIPWLLIYR